MVDLRGKKIAVAGGPLDKGWLLLQGLARRSNLDLRRQATIVYGAPPLLSEKAVQGEHDATLTFWNFCAELEGKGFKRAVDMEAIERRLGAEGPVAMVGYAFDAAWAATAAVTAAYSPAKARSAPPPSLGLDVDQVIGRATDSGDAHAIKFADTAIDAFARRRDAAILAVATQSIEQIAAG